VNAGRSDLHDLGSRREVPLVPKYGQGDSGLHLFAQEELKSTYLEWLKANDLTDRTSIPPGADFSSFSLFRTEPRILLRNSKNRLASSETSSASSEIE
jgi:hypothetical protein